MSWPLVKLGDLSESIMGQAPPGSECNKDGLGTPFVKAGEFGLERPVIREWTTKPLRYAKYDDVLLCVVGATCGKINRGADCAIGRSVAAIRAFEEKLDADYMYYFLNTWTVRLRSMSQGAAQTVINKEMIASLEIPLPPLKEQKRIAAILDKADNLRRKRQQAIALADEFLRAVFLDMFGDPVTNPKGWEVTELDDNLGFLTSGSRGWAKYYSESGDQFIRIQNVSKNKLLLEDMAYVNSPNNAEAKRTKVQLNDVLLSITADLGRSAVVTGEIVGGHINQHLALLRVNQERVNPRYLSAYLSSEEGVRQFKKKNKSAVKSGLNFTDIKTLEVVLPNIDEQRRYEAIYEKVISSVSSLKVSGEALSSLFNALSQKAFAGEL